ncbi:unnamed protein product, partial [Sphacelaria rigidula]
MQQPQQPQRRGMAGGAALTALFAPAAGVTEMKEDSATHGGAQTGTVEEGLVPVPWRRGEDRRPTNNAPTAPTAAGEAGAQLQQQHSYRLASRLNRNSNPPAYNASTPSSVLMPPKLSVGGPEDLAHQRKGDGAAVTISQRGVVSAVPIDTTPPTGAAAVGESDHVFSSSPTSTLSAIAAAAAAPRTAAMGELCDDSTSAVGSSAAAVDGGSSTVVAEGEKRDGGDGCDDGVHSAIAGDAAIIAPPARGDATVAAPAANGDNGDDVYGDRGVCVARASTTIAAADSAAAAATVPSQENTTPPSSWSDVFDTEPSSKRTTSVLADPRETGATSTVSCVTGSSGAVVSSRDSPLVAAAATAAVPSQGTAIRAGELQAMDLQAASGVLQEEKQQQRQGKRSATDAAAVLPRALPAASVSGITTAGATVAASRTPA